MTPNETKILKFIWENNGVASIFRIAKSERLGTDYLRLICEKLTRDGLVSSSGGQYKILDLGKMQLEDLGLIKKMQPANPEPIKFSVPQKPLTKNIKQKRKAKIIKKKKTDIKKEKKTKDSNIKKIEEEALAQLSISPKLKGALTEKGLTTLEAVATTAVPRLMETIKDLKLEEAATMINEARRKLKKEGKEYLWESH